MELCLRRRKRPTGWFRLSLWVIGLGGSVSGQAQFVAGEWVTRSDAKVREHRMNQVEVLVLDAEGKIVEDAEVRFEQTRHDFALGFVWPGEGGGEAVEAVLPKPGEDREFWRTMNAVSLNRVAGWRALQPKAEGDWQAEGVDRVASAAAARGWSVRWGVAVTGDPFGWPEWAVPLRGQEFFGAGRDYVKEITRRYGDRISGMDLLRPSVGEAGIDDSRVGVAMVRGWTAEVAGQAGPGLPLRVRLDQAFEGADAFAAIRAMDRVVGEAWPTDGFSVSQRFGPRALRQEDLEPALRRLARFGQPLIVTDLEVAGSNPIEAAVNLETVLRTLWAEPMVDGIYFAGLREADFAEPTAALIDAEGQATTLGRVVDRLFGEQWWSDVTVYTDALGQASARVFRGTFELTVTLPGGPQVIWPLRVTGDRTGPRRLIVMPVGE